MGCEVDAPGDHHTTKIIPLSILNLRRMKVIEQEGEKKGG